MKSFMMGKKGFKFFISISSYLMILCVSHHRNDVYSGCERSNITDKMTELSRIRIDRILAKHDVQKKIKYGSLSEKNSVNTISKKTKNDKDNTPTFTNTKKDALNKLDLYMQCYENRYSKKKGLRKLECSCEKKVFDIIDKIDKARRSNNKTWKNKLYLKYGFPFITSCLFPLLGIIFPLIDKIADEKFKKVFEHIITPDRSIIMTVFFVITTYIILALIIYVMIKIVKYERLKGNKGKMGFHEYCHFCKDVFSK